MTSWTTDASASITVCALTSRSSGDVLSRAASLRERGDDFTLARSQWPRLTGWERSQLHRPKPRSHQSLDDESQCFAQPAHFPFTSFRDGELQLPQPSIDSSRIDIARHH